MRHRAADRFAVSPQFGDPAGHGDQNDEVDDDRRHHQRHLQPVTETGRGLRRLKRGHRVQPQCQNQHQNDRHQDEQFAVDVDQVGVRGESDEQGH